MYIWQELRNSCPFVRSPLYSLGKAGGGLRVVGVAVCEVGGIMSGGLEVSDLFGPLYSCCCCCCINSCESCCNPSASCCILSSSLASLALDSARACSSEETQSLLMIEMSCLRKSEH